MRSIVKHDVLYATRSEIAMTIQVHCIPTFAAEIGNDINPEPIAVPETKNTEFKILLMMMLQL